MANDLEEALTAAGAAALVQKQIDPVLLEYQRRYAPLVRALPSVKWGSTVYYFNKRSTLPSGGFVTDGGARTVSTSNYAQENFQIRLLQSVGAVTGYSQAVTADLIGDLRAREIEGAARGLYWDLENALIWGAEAPTMRGAYPQFDGLDVMCSSFSSGAVGPQVGIGGGLIDNYGGAQTWGINAAAFNPWTDQVDQNAIDAAGTYLSLGSLDALIDLVEQNVAEPVENDEWMFLMSPTANSRLSQLLINQQRFVDRVEIAPGLIVQTYRGVPIVKSSFLSPRTNAMTVSATTATATTGGTLAAGTYWYKVSAVVSRFGEIQCNSNTVSQATTGTTSTVTLSWTPPVGPEGAAATHYKIYRYFSSSATAPTLNTQYGLCGMLDAVYLDGSGNIYQATGAIDTGAGFTPTGSGTPAAYGVQTSYQYPNATLHPLTANGEQSMFLMSRDPNNIVRPYVREMQPINVYPTTASPDSLPFAFVADTTLALRAPKYIGRLANFIGALDKTAGNGVLPTTTSYTPSFIVD